MLIRFQKPRTGHISVIEGYLCQIATPKNLMSWNITVLSQTRNLYVPHWFQICSIHVLEVKAKYPIH